MLAYWIWLTDVGIGKKQALRLLERYSSPRGIFEANAASLFAAGTPPSAMAALRNKDLTAAKKRLADCEDLGIALLPYTDVRYPQRLREIADPPLLLYYKGRLPAFDAVPAVAAVGSRRASAYGLMNAKQLGYQMGRCGLTVISGMAKGIDAMAIEGALMADAPVVGVLGCGADVIYPKENAGLFREVAQRGCLMTEYPPGTEPMGRNFPVRNRIMAGLSVGVLVVEAAARSGALITARLALEQGKDVFAVPANIGLDSARGSNALLRDGAIWTESGWDVAKEYAALFPDAVERFSVEPAASERPKSTEILRNPLTTLDKIDVDKPKTSGYIDVHEILNTLTPDERAIAELLQHGSLQADELIAKSGVPTSRLLAAVTMLEVKGIIQHLPGKIYSLAVKPQ